MRALELSLLIPTYNEGDIIEGTLREIAEALGQELCSTTEVLIVDDGRDDLISVVRHAAKALPFASVEVMRSPHPLGKGRSLARGFEVAAAPVAGFLDADLSTPPSYIRTAYDAIRKGETDVFIASRRAPGADIVRHQSLIKEWLGNGLHEIVNGFIFSGGPRYLDTQCGFKFFKSSVAKVLYKDLVAGDGLTDIEVLVRANLLGYRVREVGVKWKDVRESKRKLSRILWGELRSIAAIVYHYKILRGRNARGPT